MATAGRHHRHIDRQTPDNMFVCPMRTQTAATVGRRICSNHYEDMFLAADNLRRLGFNLEQLPVMEVQPVGRLQEP